MPRDPRPSDGDTSDRCCFSSLDWNCDTTVSSQSNASVIDLLLRPTNIMNMLKDNQLNNEYYKHVKANQLNATNIINMLKVNQLNATNIINMLKANQLNVVTNIINMLTRARMGDT